MTRDSFVELIPQEAIDPLDGYIFTLNRFHKIEKALDDALVFNQFLSVFDDRLFDLFKDRVENKLVQQIVKKKMVAVEKEVKANVENDHVRQQVSKKVASIRDGLKEESFDEGEDAAKKTICENIRDLPVGFSLDLTQKLTQRLETHRGNFLPIKSGRKWEVARSIEYSNNGKYKNIKINGNATIISNFDYYSRLVLFLISLGYCQPLVEKKRAETAKNKKLIGFQLSIPNPESVRQRSYKRTS